MADQYKVTNVAGFGSRIIDSIKGIGMGFLLFIASFGVLYWNEGRVDISSVAKTAINIDASKAAPTEANGKLISVSGKISSDEVIGDDLYLAPGKYLAIRRGVEMFAWVEKSSSKSDKNTGGSETTTTTYDYVKEWTSVPSSSANFKVPEGHANPAKTVEDYSKTVTTAKVGNYSLLMENVTLPGFTDVTMNDVNVKATGNAKLSGNYVFVPGSGSTGTLSAPVIGDTRITYTAIKQDVDATVFGKLNGTQIEPFVDASKDNAKLYRICTAGNADACVAQFANEHSTLTWILRVVGFLMMWIGLSALFGPISTLLDIVPFFGSLSRAMIGVVTLLVALVLSVVTILVSMIMHNIYAVVATAVVLVVLAVVALRMKGKKGDQKAAA